MTRSDLATQVNNLLSTITLIVIFLTPLIFLNKLTEFFETPKLIFLLISLSLLLILKSFSWVLEGKVSVTRTPLDLPLILIFLITLLSSFFSSVKQIAFFGNLPRVNDSTLAWSIYILFYFVVVSTIKSANQAKRAFYSLVLSASLVAALSLLAYFGIFPLPWSFIKLTQFSPTGSTLTSIYLFILALPPLLLSQTASNSKLIPQPLAVILSSFFILSIALLGDLTSQIIVIFAVVILYLLVVRRDSDYTEQSSASKAALLILPLILGVVTFALSNLGDVKLNPLKQKFQNFPREIQLPFSSSWKISASTFRDSPFLGTGPSTYLFNFTAYKPPEYNLTNLWNIRFDQAYNQFLQNLATTGGLGLLALIFLSLVILNFSWRSLTTESSPLVKGLSVSAILAVIILASHTITVVSALATFTVLALLMALSKHSGKIEDLSIGIKASKLTPIEGMQGLVVGDALPGILFLIILVAVIFAFWGGAKMILADYHHRLALNSASTQALETYNQLVQAENLNPNVDLYRSDLAQTNFGIANAIASSKGPSPSSPSGSLTDQDKANIQQLLSQSINEGRAATSLNPLSAQNWEILASIYRQITGVAQNALQFALDSYGRAISRDPLNPLLRLNVGGIYYSVRNYDLAIRFFTDSVNLKNDFANGYYNLSVALRDKGDLQGAQTMAEKVVSLIDPKSPDYKLAADYLSDLKARIATGSAQQATNPPPAAAETGALQQKQLPQIINNLGQPENIATPPAVKKQ